jgi:hypothetical protein
MSAQRPDRITLEFEPREPIQGHLLDSGGVAQPIQGWLELCGAIDRAWQRTVSGLPHRNPNGQGARRV